MKAPARFGFAPVRTLKQTATTATLATFLGLMATPLSQAEDHTSKAYADCLHKSGGFTVEMGDCVSEEFEGQYRRLDTAY